MNNRWYLAIDRPERGCRDYAGFFLFEIDEQKHMTLLEHWYTDLDTAELIEAARYCYWKDAE